MAQELKDYDIMDIEAMDDERLEKSSTGKIFVTRVYIKNEVDAVLALKDAEIAELKQKLESVQASMYADVVDTNVENRRLKRALWRAIALFCARSCEYFNGIMSHCLMGQDDLYKRCEEKKNKYLHAMYKCRAKAEEYK